MNILIFNWRDTKHSWAGGSEIYIHELAKRWVAQKNKVTLFCAEDVEREIPEYEVIDGVDIYRKGSRFTVYIWAIIYYFKLFRKNTDVIVDVENGIPFFTPLYSAKKKICLVYHVHGKQFFYELPFPISLIGFILEKYIFPVIYSKISLIAISKSTKKELIRIGFSSKKISLVSPGVENKGKYKSSKYKKPTILYLGRIKKYKRISILIDLLPKILVNIPNVKLIIAGWGSEAPLILDSIMKSKNKKNINVLGPVTESEKRYLLAKSWVFVNPSLHEGWGISVTEANLYGTPAVAFNVPGLSDAIEDGKTGLLCRDNEEMVEKISRLIKNKSLRAKMGKSALLMAKTLTWDRAAEKSLKVLKST